MINQSLTYTARKGIEHEADKVIYLCTSVAISYTPWPQQQNYESTVRALIYET